MNVALVQAHSLEWKGDRDTEGEIQRTETATPWYFERRCHIVGDSSPLPFGVDELAGANISERHSTGIVPTKRQEKSPYS